MSKVYSYDLWNGRKVVGQYHCIFPLNGAFLVIPIMSTFKGGEKFEQIKIPIIERLVKDDGVEFVFRRCLDVRRKSKRQIDMFKLGEKI